MRQALIFEAAQFATFHHREQKRRGVRGTPYVHHCFDVARRVAAAEIVEPFALCAAILHDVVEDTDATIEMVRAKFGHGVAEIVRQLTLPLDCRKDYSKKLAFQTAAMWKMDVYGRAIKVADKTSNVADLLDDPPKWSVSNILSYTQDAKQVVDIARVSCCGNQPPEIAMHCDGIPPELRHLVREFDQTYAAVIQRYGAHARRFHLVVVVSGLNPQPASADLLVLALDSARDRVRVLGVYPHLSLDGGLHVSVGAVAVVDEVHGLAPLPRGPLVGVDGSVRFIDQPRLVRHRKGFREGVENKLETLVRESEHRNRHGVSS